MEALKRQSIPLKPNRTRVQQVRRRVWQVGLMAFALGLVLGWGLR
jgi:hypothetical protein